MDIINSSIIEAVSQATRQTTSEAKVPPKSNARDIPREVVDLKIKRSQLIKVKNKTTSDRVELNVISKLIR